MNNPVRVRFAPSPTGPLHIGGVRTALYNYLFARQQGGQFILRIEDTDQNRYVAGAEAYIIEALQWCGLRYDEGPNVGGPLGPYRQSQRKDLYQKYAEELVDQGKAYYAFDTPDELEQWRQELQEQGQHTPQYNAITRQYMKNSLTLPAEEVKKRLESNEPYVVRVKMARDQEIHFTDLVRESVTFNTNELDDKVLLKADGMPTYHLANVVDDHLMEISHVIRGEEWLSSTPLHVFLYQAFGWDKPLFAHLPLILKPEGKGKLSKRDGDRLGFPVFPLQWTDPESKEVSAGYREEGYFPGAFLNILAMLGWNPGTEQELFSLQELVDAFSLDRVSKGGARFDPDKAKWFNEQYLRNKPGKELAEELKPLIPTDYSVETLAKICDLMKERSSFLTDIYHNGMYFFEAPKEYDEKTIRKKWKDQSAETVENLMETLDTVDEWTAEKLEARFKAFLEEKEMGFGAAMLPLRLVITGVGGGPALFDVMEIIGREESLERMQSGAENISKLAKQAEQ